MKKNDNSPTGEYTAGAEIYHIQDIERLDSNNSHRIVADFIPENGLVLDVGCATGFLGQHLKSRNISAIGIELDPQAAERARPYYQYVLVGDAASPEILAQLTSEMFDTIVLGDIIEHLTDPWTFVKAITTKLKPNGSLIVSIPHLGHASVIALLLSGSFEYRDMGLLDRTHYRFFGLESLCSLIVNAGLTPTELKRVTHDVFDTELPVLADRLPSSLVSAIDRCPEARTYQFVMKAIKSAPTEPIATYVKKFSLPGPPIDQTEHELQTYFAELENKRKELRETRDYISTCTAAIDRLVAERVEERLKLEKKIAERETTIHTLQQDLDREIDRSRHHAETAYLDQDALSALVKGTIESRVNSMCADLLSPCTDEVPEVCREPYDILIPIYNAYDHVKKCVESVLNHTAPHHQIYLLDDASTDQRILPLLTSFAERGPRIRFIASEENRGFIENINRGFGLSRNNVLILNSDTEVTAGWIDRMHRCLVSSPSIGIVSPLSNNATILSVPVMNSPNAFPTWMSPDEIAQIVSECSRKNYPRIPTAVGFCMLISRKALDQVGTFDTAFGLGYGEENDFCERAKAKGFEIVCCDDAYVHHYGEASFSKIDQIDSRRRDNMILLNERWPRYAEEVITFCRVNPLRDSQERVLHTVEKKTGEKRPSILHVIHNFDACGGTELHTRGIIDGLSGKFRSTVIYPELQPQLWSDMSSEQKADHLRVVKIVKENQMAKESFLGFAGDLSSRVIEENVARFIAGGDYEIVHIQHLADWSTLLVPLIAKELRKRVVISLHDYYLLCPEYNLVLPGVIERCGKIRADGTDSQCQYCLGTKRLSYAPHRVTPLSDYLAERNEIVQHMMEIADAVIAPSSFVRDLFGQSFGEAFLAKCRVIRHGVAPLAKSVRAARNHALRVGFLGNASDRKGVTVFIQAAQLLKGKPVQFGIFGAVPPGLSATLLRLGIRVHGQYRRKDLPRLLSKIDLVVIPSVWDETFCLTASEAQMMGVPVLASDCGAISERIIEGETGFLFPPGNAEELASRLSALSADPESLTHVISRLSTHKERTLQENAEEYVELYNGLLNESGTQEKKSEQIVRAEQNKKIQIPGLVSIVILTFNRLDCTKACVESIRRNTREPHEIIFVDNGSKDGTVQWLKQFAKGDNRYSLIENRRNHGFARGCNQGIEASRGEYILLLNNDVVVTPGWLSGLVEGITAAPDIGIVGPMTNEISGPQRVPDPGYKGLDQLDEYAKTFREKHRSRRIQARRVVGFCVLFRRLLVETIGSLDERFGSGNFEDDDYCLRAVLEGFRNMIVGDVFIHHEGSASFRGNKINYAAAVLRNEKIFNEKWSFAGLNDSQKQKLTSVYALEQADALNQRGLVADSVHVLLRALKACPADRPLYYAAAQTLINSKLYQEALDVIRALPEQSNDPRIIELLGYCKEGMDCLDEAEVCADRALTIAPGYARALNLKGVVAYKKGDAAAAAAWFRKSIESDGSYGEAWTNLGVLQWSANDRKHALDHFERAFILSPTTRDVISSYQSAATLLGEFGRLEPIIREAISIHPQNRQLAVMLIDTLRNTGKLNPAMREIESAMAAFGIEDLLPFAVELRKMIGPKSIPQDRPKQEALSICIIVKDEEPHLSRCLLSVRDLADELIVVDTGSSDRTPQIAAAFGAVVHNFPWQYDFSAARNFSLSKASSGWILVLDADEMIAPSDHEALRQIISKKNARPVAYSFITRNYVHDMSASGWKANDGWYRNEQAGSGWVPSEKVRLFPNRNEIRFENPVHELVEPSLKRSGFPVNKCPVPIHHYGKLNGRKTTEKGTHYYDLGRKKLSGQDESSALYELAVQAGELGKYDEAVDLWHQVIARNPDMPEPYLNLSHLHLEQDRFEEARSAAEKASMCKPRLKEAEYNHALCELYSGDPGKSIAILEPLCREFAGYYIAHFVLAAAYCCSGKQEKALEMFIQMTRKNLDLADAVRGIARKLNTAGRQGCAMLLLETAVKNKTISKEIIELLTDSYREMGWSQPQEAANS